MDSMFPVHMTVVIMITHVVHLINFKYKRKMVSVIYIEYLGL